MRCLTIMRSTAHSGKVILEFASRSLGHDRVFDQLLATKIPFQQ
jgi:hypothetical protein